MRQLRQPARPVDLINPRSRINGETPKFVETEHFFLDLPALAGSLGKWLAARTDWRPNVLKFSQNLLEDLSPGRSRGTSTGGCRCRWTAGGTSR